MHIEWFNENSRILIRLVVAGSRAAREATDFQINSSTDQIQLKREGGSVQSVAGYWRSRRDYPPSLLLGRHLHSNVQPRGGCFHSMVQAI